MIKMMKMTIEKQLEMTGNDHRKIVGNKINMKEYINNIKLICSLRLLTTWGRLPDEIQKHKLQQKIS